MAQQDEDACAVLQETALLRLSEQGVVAVSTRPTGEMLEVVVTVLGPRAMPLEEALEEAMRESLAQVLATQTLRKLSERTGGRAVAIADSKCDWSDEADCETAQGEIANAFVTGERCYRIVFQMALQ